MKKTNFKKMISMALSIMIILSSIVGTGFLSPIAVYAADPIIPTADSVTQAVITAEETQQAELLIQATAAVNQVEQSLTTEDLNAAQALVNALPINDSSKDALNTRLTTASTNVTKANTARTKLTTLEANPTVDNYDIAQTAISELPNVQAKTDLQNRLNEMNFNDTLPPTAPSNTLTYVTEGNDVKPQVTITNGVEQTSKVSKNISVYGSYKTTYGSSQQSSGSFIVPLDATNCVLNYYAGGAYIYSGATQVYLDEYNPSGTQTGTIKLGGPGADAPYNTKSVYYYGNSYSSPQSLKPGYSYKFRVGYTGSSYSNSNCYGQISSMSMTYSKSVPFGVSGVDKSQYRINDGQWIDYAGPFYLDVFGAVKVESKTLDRAGNASTITVNNYNVVDISSVKSQIEEKLTRLEQMLLDHPTQSKVNEEKALISEIEGLLPYVSINDPDYAGYNNRINACQQAIALAQKIVDATNAVVTAETASNTLTNQTQINAAQSYYNPALTLVNALPNGAVKTDLLNRLDRVKVKIATAYVVLAETSKTAASVTTAAPFVNQLDNGSEKDNLNARLENVRIQIATALVVNAETVKTEDSVITARDSVALLIDGIAKDELNARLDATQREIALPFDDVAPNLPVIAEANTVVTITATDRGGEAIVNINTIEGFESTPAFTMTGNWAKTTAQKATGAYSWKSATIGNRASTTSQFNVTVPAGVTNANLSFKYLVSSENNYDWLNIYVDGTQVVHKSGAGAWTAYSKALTAGTHTIKFEYAKDGSGVSGSDAAFIDDIRFTYSGAKIFLPTGVKEIEYKINDGEWQTYEGAFTPDAIGEVLITARATDYANNVSQEASLTVTIQNNNTKLIEDGLTALGALIRDLNTQDKIDNANELVQEIQALIDMINDESKKTDFQNELNNDIRTIDLAQDVLDATNAVNEVKEALVDVTTQEKIDDLRNLIDKAQILVDRLPEGETKSSLENQLKEAQIIVNIAEATMKVENAENAIIDLSTLSICDTAEAIYGDALGTVNALPDGSIKSDLLDRLEYVKTAIDNARESIKLAQAEEAARSKVVEAEQSVSQTVLDDAKKLVDALPVNSTVKEELTDRINYVQSLIDAANEVNKLDESLSAFLDELVKSDITTDSTFDKMEKQVAAIRVEYDKVNAIVSQIKDSANPTLSNRLHDLQDKLNHINKMLKTVEDLLGEQKNYRHSNGTAANRVKVGRKTTTDLMSMYASQIEKSLGFDVLIWLSWNKDIATIDQSGKMITIKNGIEKITVFNENGYMDFYFVVAGN